MLAADICQPENLEASPQPNQHCVNKAQRLHHIQPNLPPKIIMIKKKNYYSSSNIYVWELIIGCFRYFLQTANHTVVNTRIKFFCVIDMILSINLISI